MKKILPVLVVIFIVVASLSFYAGYSYGQRKNTFNRGMRGNFANLSPEERQARIEQFGASGRGGFEGGARTMRDSANFVTGEIISLQGDLLTVKLPDGGSRNILLSASTLITRSAAGSVDDLLVGKIIAVSGQSHDDGSLTAGTVQIRSELSAHPQGPPSPSVQIEQ